ncbi:MAG TPA: hypothetical protein VFQ91_14985 [Bryobacteraceae bacterium]|nr:hypothetical protein [Bryobacteraceae bacterium]
MFALPPYLLTAKDFDQFLASFSSGELPRAEWNHAAHLAIAAATLHVRPDPSAVRDRILAYNAKQGIVSTPDYGYHETVTQFWVERITELAAGLGRGASAWDSARAAVAAFAHRGRLFDAYYTFDILQSREARASYIPPDAAG